MTRFTAVGLTVLAVAGYGSVARAEDKTSLPDEIPSASPPLPSVSQEPLQQVPATTEPKGTQASRPAAAPAVSPTSQPVAPIPPPQVASKPEAKAASAKAPWDPLQPCKRADGEHDLSTDCQGVFGVRGSITHLSVGKNTNAMGLMASIEGEAYGRRGLWSERLLHRLALGGGDAGLEGTLAGSWAGGVWIPAGPCGRHGPVLRAGMNAYLRGNDAYYASLVELPQLQIGYQYFHDKTLVELGATTGAVLVGRSRTDGSAMRTVGNGLELGWYAAVQLAWLRLGLGSTRLPANDGLPQSVRVFEGNLCVRMNPVAFCIDARSTNTYATITPGAPAGAVSSLYTGITMGFSRE